MNDLGFLDFDADFSAPNIVDAYDELPLWSSMFGLLLLEHVPLAGVRAALDVGCGTGFPLIELAERLGGLCEVHGIDPWSAALRRAEEKIRNRCLRNVTIHEGSAAAMPFQSDTFDLIVSNLGINNFEDRAAVVRECRRVAREDATLALTTNLQGHMREFYDVFEEVLDDAGDQQALDRLSAHVAHRADVPEVRDLLESGGFSVRRVVERFEVMRFASGTALFNHHFIKLGFLDAWKAIVPDAGREVFARLRTALDEHARREGELRLTIPMAYIEARPA